VTAVDLKLTNPSVAISKIKGLFPTEVGFELIEAFYQENGELECSDFGKLELATEGVGVDSSVKSEFGKELEFKDEAKINAFKLQLLAGKRAEISCRLQVHPTAKQIADLSDMLNQSVTVSASWKKTQAEEDAERQQQLDVEREQRAAGEPKEEEQEEGATA
jgi:hypothetical protein